MREITILQQSSRWRERDNAAHRLAEYDWKCHPEIVAALVDSLLHDPQDDVRAEAAETLGKLKPCVPEVHEALARVAKCDPDHEPRKYAKKALKKLGKSCDAECLVCDPSFRTEIIEGPSEPILMNPSVEPMDMPPSDLPEPMPSDSPFGNMPQASRDGKKPTATALKTAAVKPSRAGLGLPNSRSAGRGLPYR